MRFRYFGLAILMLSLFVFSGISYADEVTSEESERLSAFLKKLIGANLPPGTEIEVEGYTESPIEGFKSGVFKLETQRGPATEPFLISEDGKYVVFGEPQSLDNFKDSPVKGLKEGEFNRGGRALPALVTEDGEYIILGGKLMDSSVDPHKEIMDQISMEDLPIKGAADAKITIVEYSDFQCPFCKKGKELLPDLLTEYEGKIKIAFKQLPLGMHKWAMGASVASICAYQQGNDKFWEFHDAIFDNQGTIKEETATEQFKGYAKDLGLDEQKFGECLESTEVKARVLKEAAEAQRLGITSTPTFVVNGMVIPGANPQGIKSAIEQKLAEGS